MTNTINREVMLRAADVVERHTAGKGEYDFDGKVVHTVTVTLNNSDVEVTIEGDDISNGLVESLPPIKEYV